MGGGNPGQSGLIMPGSLGYCCFLGCDQIQGLAMLLHKLKCCEAEHLSILYLG